MSNLKTGSGRFIKTMRVDKGTWNELIESAWQYYKDGGRESIQHAFTQAVMDSVLSRYHDKIAAGFRKAGYDIGVEPLNSAMLAQFVSDKTGLEIATLTPEAVTGAIDRELSARLSEILQVEVTSVLNADTFKASLEQAAIKAIEDGRAVDFISRVARKAARRYATFAKAGISDREMQKRIMNREYQRRWRVNHKLMWE